MDPSKAQHRIWEDVDFCALKIDNCFITNQWQLSPWISFPMNFLQIINLILFAHQFYCDVEHSLKSEIRRIHDGRLIVHEILSHECRPIHRRSHEHSPKLLNALLQNLQCSTFFSVFVALDLLLHSKILLCHFPWRKFPILPLPGSERYQVALIHHESSLRTLRIPHFRREEHLHDEGELVALHPKKFHQVALIDRAP